MVEERDGAKNDDPHVVKTTPSDHCLAPSIGVQDDQVGSEGVPVDLQKKSSVLPTRGGDKAIKDVAKGTNEVMKDATGDADKAMKDATGDADGVMKDGCRGW